MSIRLLDSALVDQIAAGEVVERPASVVKELLDNAIDAGATRIVVELQEGGSERILVQDNGRGMNRADAEMATVRHATSKIASLEDLERIATLGFRGEALASIASVSHFRLLTRPLEEIEGTEIRVEGGKGRKVSVAGCSAGTTVDVQGLFYNVPARRKFLRTRETELRHVREMCLDAALANPKLSLKLSHNGRLVREYVPESLGGREGRALRALRVHGDLELFEVAGSRNGVSVDGVLAYAQDARRGMRHLRVFVNGRHVTAPRIAFAAQHAFGDRIQSGRYPVGVLFVELDATEVDVNAHPQKSEVRFRSPGRVSDSVESSVSRAILLIEKSDASEPDEQSPKGVVCDSFSSQKTRSLRRGRAFWGERLSSGPTVGTGGYPAHDFEKKQLNPVGSEINSVEAEINPVEAENNPVEADKSLVESETVSAFRGLLSGGGSLVPKPVKTVQNQRKQSKSRKKETSNSNLEPVKQSSHHSTGFHHCGELASGALLIESEGSLFLIWPRDIDRAIGRHRLSEGKSHKILFPVQIHIESDTFDMERLNELGFDLVHLGGSTFAVHAIPELFASCEEGKIESLVIHALDGLDTLLKLAPKSKGVDFETFLGKSALKELAFKTFPLPESTS